MNKQTEQLAAAAKEVAEMLNSSNTTYMESAKSMLEYLNNEAEQIKAQKEIATAILYRIEKQQEDNSSRRERFQIILKELGEA